MTLALTPAAPRSLTLLVRRGETLRYTQTGSFTGVLRFEDRLGTAGWRAGEDITANASGAILNDSSADRYVSLFAPSITGAEEIDYTLTVESAPVGGLITRIHGAGAPTDAVTGAGIVEIGGEYRDDTTGDRWLNSGASASYASPVWVLVPLIKPS